MEEEQCTFRPSVGVNKGRSASVEPRLRSNTPCSSSSEQRVGRASAAAPDAFAARAARLQENREQRLERLRKEKRDMEMQEATFQPFTGRIERGVSTRGGGSGGGVSAAAAAADFEAPVAPMEGGMAVAQIKVAAPDVRKEPVGFKVSEPDIFSCFPFFLTVLLLFAGNVVVRMWLW